MAGSLASPSKAVNREYEEYVLTGGDFDERVFLGADADEEIGTPRKATATELPEGQLSCRLQMGCNLQQHFEKVQLELWLQGELYIQSWSSKGHVYFSPCRHARSHPLPP